MTYQYARIRLEDTKYQPIVSWTYIKEFDKNTIDQLLDIYRTYCIYKRFASVMPVFPSRFTEPNVDVLAYWDQDRMVAWSMIKRYDDHNALCDQFAWNYHKPRARLGIETLKTECAIYQQRGFQYLYLDQAHSYKREINGFEILGGMT